MIFSLRLMILIPILMLSTLDGNCQHPYERVWPIGGSSVELGNRQLFINFTEDSTYIIPAPNASNFLIQRTNASICNLDGNLQLYTNGFIVADESGSIIINGDTLIESGSFFNHSSGLTGNIYPQGSVILPYPGKVGTYLLLYNDHNFWPDQEDPVWAVLPKTFYATVGLTSNGFEVFEKAIPLEDDILDHYIYAIPHKNGQDYWILSKSLQNNEFIFYLIDHQGIKYSHRQFINDTFPDFRGWGCIKLSPDGTYLAKFRAGDGLELIDIDRSTGQLTNYRHMDIPVFIFPQQGSLDFSPSGRFIYFTDVTQLYQVDMHADDWRASTILIDTFDNSLTNNFFPNTFRDVKRTPDCRIFIASAGSTPYIHVIHEPEKSGKDCRFEQRAIKLETLQYGGFPNTPDFNLGTKWENYCEELSTAVHDPLQESLVINVWPNPATNIVSFEWDESMKLKLARLYDISGKLLDAIDISGTLQSSFWLNNYPSGFYLIEFEDVNGMKFHKKVIKKY